MHEDYMRSMRKAIVEYVMRNPLERDRLGLGGLDRIWPEYQLWATWWRRPAFRETPPSWKAAYATATHDLAYSLQTLSPNVLELSSIWQSHSGVAGKVLVDVGSPAFVAQLPVTLDEFKGLQAVQTERIRNLLWTMWVPKCGEVFRRLPPLYINNDAPAYWRSIATLQSNQLRSLVQDSINAYVAYFESHVAVDEIDPLGSNLLWSQHATFKVELVVTEGGALDFSPRLPAVMDAAVDVVRNVVEAIQGLPRVEAGGQSQGGQAGGREHEIPSTRLDELSVRDAETRLVHVIEANMKAPETLATLFDDMLFLVALEVEAHCETFAKEKNVSGGLETYTEEIERFQRVMEAIENTCTDSVRTGLFEVQCGGLKQQLLLKAKTVIRGLLEQIRDATATSNQAICSAYEDMMKKLSKVSTTSEEVVALKKFYAKFQQDQDTLREDIEFNKERDEYLERYYYPVLEEDVMWAMKARQWPRKMSEIMREAITRANAEEQRFQKELRDAVEDFKAEVSELEEQVLEFETMGGAQNRNVRAPRVEQIMSKLRAAVETAEELNAQEKVLGLPNTSFANVQMAIQKLEPFVALWTTTKYFFEMHNLWTNDREMPFSKLDPELIENEIGECHRKIYKLCKVFSGAGSGKELKEPLSVADFTKEKIEAFRAMIPLITAICNKGLHPRHWLEMNEVVGFEIKPSEVLGKLADKLAQLETEDPTGQLIAISDRASREYSIEKQLTKMMGEWGELALEFNEYGATGTFILKGGPLDEAQVLLDDHIVKSKAMMSSPFAKPHLANIGPWEAKLSRLQLTLDEWLKCQGRWMYLQPIFGSEEIVRQIPTEGLAFKAMDESWRKIMQETRVEPGLMAVAALPSLLEDLQGCNAKLDIVEKGLNDFLETKKAAFPRFYFLSNDQLLEILSECKDPHKIQEFTQKIFEAVGAFKFLPTGEIVGMASVEDERIPWIENVHPGRIGAVETWLTKCETVIYQTMHKLARDSIADYATKPRTDWILQWPGQLVLNCGQVYWTKEVTDAIASGGTKGLAEFSKRCTSDLNDIVQLVRGELTKLQRMSVGALVVIDVHARDVCDAMVQQKVERLDDFNWEAQLRYYWEYNETPPSKVEPTETIMVRMINASALYGYEYQGNSTRLVITPLTDRCYRTLIGAIYMNLGGAPAGPAGTGKTETVKDLAKALAIKCVVTNCSDSLNYKAMAKFFKGIGCSGCWICYDEFNRIELEVLSVVAQQVLTILRAKATNAPTFNLDGSDLPLVMTCNSFITMNPGYAGRAELPDNLKALYRDVAMMVPDYAMISEIMLYSYGYMEARALARKLVATYRLCSEQLSTQFHYDYGMRAVMAVLRAAANLKRKFGDQLSESILMLRALTDVNLPKFLDQDVPLFHGIVQDLFPGVELPEPDYVALTDALRDNAVKRGLQPIQEFFNKIIQLYEMIIVRHGLMLVGESFGMKTESYRVLADALGDLCLSGQMGENKVQQFVINPKAQPQRQLYGYEDPVSKEWADGVLAVYFRKAALDKTPDRKWVLLDGPVDAVWIEDMNTVLDDNKKLCLSSGEQISMNAMMNMIFEVDDLSQASPATVSRCGMVYMQAALLGWRPVMDSWMATLPAGVADTLKDELEALFMWLMPPTLRVATKIVKRPVPMHEINLARSTMRIIESLMDEFRDQPQKIAEMNPNIQKVWVQSIFLFALVWSVGACTDEAGRAEFDSTLRRLLVGDVPAELKPWMGGPSVPITQLFPEGKLVYDYTFDKERAKWVPWLQTIDKSAMTLDPEMAFANIIVPTADTVRSTFIFNALTTHAHPVLFVGPTGTGKSVYVKGHLQNGMDAGMYSHMFINFSAQTSENMTQDIIDGKLDRPRRGAHKGIKIYAPPENKKMIIFVDDLNMPKPEKYKAQPPIELLRQWMDHQGWYDRLDNVEKHFKQVDHVQFCAAMGPPGGGRNSVTNRYLRHFSVLAVTAFDADTNLTIFSALLDWWFLKYEYDQSFTKHARNMVQTTIDIFDTVTRELLPTPTKSHYLFNLRDLSRVFQGMTMSEKNLADPQMMLRLWIHELMRVFHDRLIDDHDRNWICTTIETLVEKNFKDKMFKLVARKENKDEKLDMTALRSNLFGDFMIPGADPKKYTEIEGMEALISVCKDYLSDYNAMSKKPMDLVLFQFAVEHVARICRVLRQPGGNALLVGLGGSGRQSLTRLSAFISEFECVQIEISKTYGLNEWRDDIRLMLRKAGEQNKPTVFLFSDTQIKDETYVEDISNLLNTYEVPNLFQASDLMQIYENIRPRAKQAGMDNNLYQFFLSEVKRNFHIVLSFSYVGDAFRERLRMFPSLVNCCTINWFTRWPDEALETVATSFLANLRDQDVPEEVLEVLPRACMFFQSSVVELTDRFQTEMRRHNYVTPTSYLELLLSYRDLLKQKQEEISTVKYRYENGLRQLRDAEGEVGKLKEQIIEMQPKLDVAVKETEEAMVIIDAETKSAMEIKAVVEVEEASAMAEAKRVQEIKDDCQADLDKAMPLVVAANKAASALTKSAITELKSFKSPAPAVVKVAEAVVILFQEPVAKKKDEKTGKMALDYWGAAKLLMGGGDFQKMCMEFDKDGMTAELIAKVEPYIKDEEFNEAFVSGKSQAAGSMCAWVCAMYSYYQAMLIVGPKKAGLEKAEAELKVVMDALAEKQAELKEVMDKLAALQASFDEKKGNKDKLEADVDRCKKQLDRAGKLIDGLGGEKERWTQKAADLTVQYNMLIGDVLLAAGQIAYLGPFTQSYRNDCVDGWVAKLKELGVPCADAFDLVTVLGNEVLIQQWNIWGLPRDHFSSENAISLSMGRRWPMCIDPQGLANGWIRNMEAKNDMVVTKMTDSNFLRTLENSIPLGIPVLLENVEETLDAALEPLLQKQIFKQAGAWSIKLGDQNIEYDMKFKFFMTTKLRNPHFAPELCTKVSVLNFMTTFEGLEDQLLAVVVAQERPDLQEEKSKLIVQGAENKKKLQDIESEILRVLSSSSGNILDDEEAVDILQSSKVLSDDITIKQAAAAETEIKIDEARQGYKPVASHSSTLYFCVTDMGNIDPMYQYSLGWFNGLFTRAITESEQSEDLDQRLENLNGFFTYLLFQNVSRSLFEKDKLLFAFLLCCKIKAAGGNLDLQELRFLLTGGVSLGGEVAPNPTAEDGMWLSDRSWGELIRTETLAPAWEGISAHVSENPSDWKKIFDAVAPHAEPLPSPWCDQLTSFQQLLVLRVIRQDKLIPGITQYVAKEMGARFTEPMPFNIEPSYNDSTPTTPLIFVLTQGSDPMNSLITFAGERNIRLETVSLGQGQGPVAQKWISEGAKEGFWVCLQNCHLAERFLPTLEQICEQQLVAGKVHRDFRLWLTSYPSPAFPISILENSVKITNEPPKGLSAGLLRTFMMNPVTDAEFFYGCEKDKEFRKMLFGLALFHSIIYERKKFGPIGWNIPYEFNENDLRISVRQLQVFLNEYESIPFDTLRYTCGECNYGGKVTDGHDRVTLMTILDDYYTDRLVLDPGYTSSPSGLYKPLPDGKHEDYLAYIRGLPLLAGPEAFGLHDNADISKDLKETNELLDNMLLTQSRAGGGGGSSAEETIGNVASDILLRLPRNFDIELTALKYPQDYNNSMNTVLVQELERVNVLLTTIRISLVNLGKAVKGLAIMSAELDDVAVALFNGKVPAMWLARSFPSMKNLAAYVQELLDRCAFFQKWIDDGAPVVNWISGFFFTQVS